METPELEKAEYRVEPKGKACQHCGLGEMWDVVDSDDVALGISYGSKEDAEEMADELNRAFLRGLRWSG